YYPFREWHEYLMKKKKFDDLAKNEFIRNLFENVDVRKDFLVIRKFGGKPCAALDKKDNSVTANGIINFIETKLNGFIPDLKSSNSHYECFFDYFERTENNQNDGANKIYVNNGYQYGAAFGFSNEKLRR